jgi:hypothetical protein
MDSIFKKNHWTGLTGSTGFFPGFPEESLETASPSARKALLASFGETNRLVGAEELA